MTDLSEGSWIKAMGIDTHYHDTDGQGDVVVLLHGSGPGASAWANWKLALPYLSADFRVVAPDYVGFGSTERPDGLVYSADLWAEHVLAFLDELGITRFHVVGNSMGGAIALRLARDVPDRIGKMVLMGSGGIKRVPPPPGAIQMRQYKPSVENMRSLITAGFLYDASLATDALVEERYQASCAPGVQETYEHMFFGEGQRGNEHQLPDDELAAITTDTLIIHGREDRIIPIENSWALFHLLPNSRFVGLSECGHWAQIEQAEAFNPMVRRFFGA